MSTRAVLLAVLAAAALTLPASAGEMTVGLTVVASPWCAAGPCLRRVPGRYHAATVAGARPLKRDRRVCAEAFDADLIAVAGHASPDKRQLYRMRRCRALGLAPVIAVVGGQPRAAR